MLAILKIALGSGLVVVAAVGTAAALGLVPRSVWALPPAVGALTAAARLLGRLARGDSDAAELIGVAMAADSSDGRDATREPVPDNVTDGLSAMGTELAAPPATNQRDCPGCGVRNEQRDPIRSTWILCSGVMIQVVEYSCTGCRSVLRRS